MAGIPAKFVKWIDSKYGYSKCLYKHQIIGDIAHSKTFSEMAYEAAELKELYVVPCAKHIDLYHDTNKILFDKLEIFFKDAFQ